MENAQRDEFVIKLGQVVPSKNDIFVLRILDIVNLLGIAKEVQKDVLKDDFDWNNYSHLEALARYCMGVLEEMNCE